MSARRTAHALGHSKQASQLKEQLQGLVPDSLGSAVTAAESAATTAGEAVTTAAHDAGDGLRKLLDYVQLASEYRQPIAELIQRLMRRTSAVADDVQTAVASKTRGRKWRLGWRLPLVVGAVAALGLIAYGMSGAVRNPTKDV